MFLISLASGFGDVFPLLSAVNFRWSSVPIHLSFLSLPWGSKISLVGAQIFILIGFAHLCRDSANQVHLFALAAPSIDVAKVQKK